MKNPASIGSSLVACLGALGLATLSTPSRSATVPAPEARSALSVWHVETCAQPESLASPLVAEVRRVIGQRRRSSADQPTASVVRDALQAKYGESVSEDTDELAYYWWWNPVTEQWERVCTGVSSFRVDFGAGGTVLVRTNDDMLLR